MAANTKTNKRIPIKWVRDKAKAAYTKKSECYICGDIENLELHHTHGLTNLLEKWIKDKGYILETDEDILAIRDKFIAEFHREIYDEVFTLCLLHHKNLHNIYGKSPPLSTAPKQVIWIQKQKDKFNGVETTTTSDKSLSKLGYFSGFTSSGETKSSSRGYIKSIRFTSFI